MKKLYYQQDKPDEGGAWTRLVDQFHPRRSRVDRLVVRLAGRLPPGFNRNRSSKHFVYIVCVWRRGYSRRHYRIYRFYIQFGYNPCSNSYYFHVNSFIPVHNLFLSGPVLYIYIYRVRITFFLLLFLPLYIVVRDPEKNK